MYVYARWNDKEQTSVYAIFEPRDAMGAREGAQVQVIPVGAAQETIRRITEGDEATAQPKLVIQPYDEAVSIDVVMELDPEGGVRFNGGLLRSQALKLYGEAALEKAEHRSLWRGVRSQRALLLTACDWTQLEDANLTPEKKKTWTDYRQQLRDITSAFSKPSDVIWPKKP